MSGFPRSNPSSQREGEYRHDRREDRREQTYGDYDEREQYHPQQRSNYDSPAYPQSQSQSQSTYQSQSQSQSQSHPRGGYQDQGGYHNQAPPSGHPSSGRGNQHDRDFERDDFASDAEFNKMMASGAFNEGRRDRDRYGASEREPQRERYGQQRENERYGERDPQPQRGDYRGYDAPSGPPQGRQYDRDTYGSSDRQQYAPSSEGPGHYGQQAQGRGQYGGGESRGRDNAPAGGFTASGGYGTSRDEEDRYGGPTPRRGEEPPRRGEADSYYKSQTQSGKGNNPYSHLAGMAHAHGEGDDDHDVYHKATQGLHEHIQSRPQRADQEPDYKAHADAHRKAYGDDDSHGPLDADTIGAAAAMEAIKQTAAAGGGGAPSGGFLGGKSSGGAARPHAKEEEEEADTAPARGSGGGGLQDKVMALAMSQAGKLFDKKNGGSASAGGGGKPQDKAQAMQSAAATAMQLFAQYQTKGKVETSDVMGLAMKFL